MERMIDMVMESRYGLMELNTKVNGIITKLKVREHSGMQKVMFTMENLKMTKQMVMVYIRT